MTDTGDIISAVIGWVYFAAWTISFWPQIISNYRRKSVVGLSFDYVFLNIIGFTCYSAYNLSLFWNPTIQQQYKNFYGEANKVQPNDVAFALHAVAASTLTGIQIFIYHQVRICRTSPIRMGRSDIGRGVAFEIASRHV
eukprot:TRINITY_DN2564_c0_g1_i1.p1 TRINITY_DN2564_c0_g1~~TRINITY_DN2564_c0_g1_i1.p1  ORF type:complete len:139 (-),score=3.01 TRINITY_DN2564_c0_g1_i1:161-577(-)